MVCIRYASLLNQSTFGRHLKKGNQYCWLFCFVLLKLQDDLTNNCFFVSFRELTLFLRDSVFLGCLVQFRIRDKFTMLVLIVWALKNHLPL